jgi:hypothetical protein
LEGDGTRKGEPKTVQLRERLAPGRDYFLSENDLRD